MNCNSPSSAPLTACLSLALSFIVTLIVIAQTVNPPIEYDVVWDTPSANASQAMPCGGGDVGLLVWVEDGDLLFYLSKSGTFDENNTFLKLGRTRVTLSPNPLEGADVFEQRLNLRDGHISVMAQKGSQEVNIDIWVDALRPVAHVECQATEPVSFTATYETWRTEDRPVPDAQRHQCFSYTGFPGEVTTFQDTIDFEGNTVGWHHRNRTDELLINFCIEQQGLSAFADQFWNPQINRTFGGLMQGDNLVANGTVTGTYSDTDFTGWRLSSAAPSLNHSVQVYLHHGQTDTLAEWETQLTDIIIDAEANEATAREETIQWWHDYWDRSWLVISPDQHDPDSPAWQVGRNYQLFRYMLGCNATGEFPSKFNGSLFTADPQFIRNRDGTPDFRLWGGGSFTAQNQRLVYWPMLKSGDFDLMPSQFEYYRRPLGNAEIRSQVYWGHDGCSFTEQVENFGLPFAGGWGFENGSGTRRRLDSDEFGTQTNRFVRRHFVNQVEFSLMILDYYHFTGNDISAYIPFIESSLRFFNEHYRFRNQQINGTELNSDGKLVIFPSTAAETYRDQTNPADVVSALQVVLARLIELPDSLLPQDRKDEWAAVLETVPELHTIELSGRTVLAPGIGTLTQSNAEIPELYPVFPYGIFGVGKPDLQLGIDTWNFGPSNDNHIIQSWSQVGIFTARLGLTEEARNFAIAKMADAPNRFPAFWGPGFDYTPDFNHGGSGMIGVQEMLMQTSGDVIQLLPAWPEDWSVDFKLHAPMNTTVEGSYRDGRLLNLKVTPESRLQDIVFPEDVTEIPTSGLVQYIDIDSTNTVTENGSAITDSWQIRTGIGGANDTVYQSANTASQPLTTTITGLTDGDRYQVYSYFAVATTAAGVLNHWFVDSALATDPLTNFVARNISGGVPEGSTGSIPAREQQFDASAPNVELANEVILHAADLGEAIVSNGQIQVVNANLGRGSSNNPADRIWLEGIGIRSLNNSNNNFRTNFRSSLQSSSSSEPDTAVLSWDATVGRRYRVESGINLADWPDVIVDEMIADSITEQIEISTTPDSVRFYRIIELPQENFN